jgi:hypothetical protein
LYVIPLRIVGSGFCPMVRGLPHAMLAQTPGVGKAETYSSTVGCVVFEKQVIALLCRVWYNWDKVKESVGGNSYDDR